MASFERSRHAHIHGHRHFARGHVYQHFQEMETPTVREIPSPVELAKRSTDTCEGKDSGACQHPTSNSAAIPIAVSVIVPVTIALVLFIILHRRHLRKLAREDANDKTKSLDFGMGPNWQLPGAKKGKKNKKSPEMVDTGMANLEHTIRHGHGVSMDMLNSPYLLPPEMQGSTDSLRSLGKVVPGQHDPYRAASLKGKHEDSIHEFSRKDDSSSTMTGSTSRLKDGMSQNLIQNAQRMSQSDPQVVDDLPAELAAEKSPVHAIHRKELPVPSPTQDRGLLSPVELDASHRESDTRVASAVRHSNNYLAGFIQSREASVERSTSASPEAHAQSPEHHSPPPPSQSPPNQSTPARGASLTDHTQQPLPTISIEPEYGYEEYEEIVVPPEPNAASRAPGGTAHIEDEYDGGLDYYEYEAGADVEGLGVMEDGFDPNRRLSILRPLPPEDPNDSAEQRANRIRSFYKEYFSDDQPARAYQGGGAEYYEDYGSEFPMGDAAIFDPATGQFIVAQAPFAEPVTRRAMTPPPRGPPQFRPRGRQGSTVSTQNRRNRAFSSASTSRMGPGGPPGPKKKLPPPKALRTLPTPHMLGEDAFALPIDFAPPSTVKDRQAGRPDSPFSQRRPYSPAVPIASPLVSSFSELPSMPSPHALRKSGTFTALDFALPPRIKTSDTASDNGSIRSGRSGRSAMTAAQHHHLRNGAYRLSRVPKELVGSKQEFAQSLRPQWKVGS